MRLSLAIQTKIFNVLVGGILNAFKISTRRTTYFFEDITANYFKVGMKKGFEKEFEKIGFDWGFLIHSVLLPTIFKKTSIDYHFQGVLFKIWQNTGLMDCLKATSQNDKYLELSIDNEFLTRLIGPNSAVVGFYRGLISSFTGRKTILIEANQTKMKAKYVFELTKTKQINSHPHKTQKEYFALNKLPKVEGLTLKTALDAGILKLSAQNRITFRDKLVSPVENTAFHVIGNAGILLDEVPKISFRYFKGLVERDASDERKLVLLKTLLQVMGWGIITIEMESKNKIKVIIDHPPYGLQKEKDNWEFLIKTIQGYLWLINRKLKARKRTKKGKKLIIDYAI